MTRHAVLSDVHSNLEAFQAVLDDLAARGGCDSVLCLGDVVGYGPDPHACIDLLRSVPHVCVVGNHDLASIGALDTAAFNPYAAEAARWTSEQLTPEDRQYLAALPQVLEAGQFTVVHGSPRQPITEYLLTALEAEANLGLFATDHCLVGHSHVPLAFRCHGDGPPRCAGERWHDGDELVLGGGRMFINPGAVGQPRDGDWRASYALVDLGAGSMRLRRVGYDVAATQAKMLRQGLPLPLARRLGLGR